MTFTDEIILNICAGHGGNGVVRWHRNRRNQKGGPAGGDGGKGGDVYLRGVRDIEVLSRYISNPKFKASDGGHGGGNSLEGSDGADLFIDVPVGSVITQIRPEDHQMIEIRKEGESVKLLQGGRGGFGNEHFKSSRNVTPIEQTDGKKGECADFRVELRLIADAGFIGFPNAGKSTLLNVLTNSGVKVGNYSFTTLEPNLGAFKGYILADIPGLIKGASSGKGLGDKFLRHIMRTNMLVHCISAELDDIEAAYNTVRKELGNYDPALLNKKEILLITKSDTIGSRRLSDLLAEAQTLNPNVLSISVLEDDSIKAFEYYLIHELKGIYR